MGQWCKSDSLLHSASGKTPLQMKESQMRELLTHSLQNGRELAIPPPTLILDPDNFIHYILAAAGRKDKEPSKPHT